MQDRTVTLPTRDAGDVTLPEPAWCAGHPQPRPEYEADLTHYGPEQPLAFGDEQLYTVVLAQNPRALIAPRVTRVYVEQTSWAANLDPAGLDDLAAAMVEHAAILRSWARVLASVLAKEGERS
ncbi:hypothetical protein PV350_13990 [Streptomyces sp. PA03-6a]|nr:hypothetical protein [Streptomyces sp. PA03-6a]